MGKVGRYMMKAKNQGGATKKDLSRMYKVANEAAQKMEQEAEEKAVVRTLGIVLNVLANDYWSKTAKKRAPKFIEDCMSLYDSVRAGVVTDKQLEDLLYELAGVKVERECNKARKELVNR